MIYVVSYDLSPTIFRDVSPFLQQLQSTEGGRTWWHFLNNTWLISTPETTQQLYERLQPQLKETDRLLIMRVEPDFNGYLPQDAWAWIRQRAADGAFAPPMGALYAAPGYRQR